MEKRNTKCRPADGFLGEIWAHRARIPSEVMDGPVAAAGEHCIQPTVFYLVQSVTGSMSSVPSLNSAQDNNMCCIEAVYSLL